jgi:hypothetical protein
VGTVEPRFTKNVRGKNTLITGASSSVVFVPCQSALLFAIKERQTQDIRKCCFIFARLLNIRAQQQSHKRAVAYQPIKEPVSRIDVSASSKDEELSYA